LRPGRPARSVAVLFAIPHPRLNCLDQDATHGVLNSFTPSQWKTTVCRPYAHGQALRTTQRCVRRVVQVPSYGRDPRTGMASRLRCCQSRQGDWRRRQQSGQHALLPAGLPSY